MDKINAEIVLGGLDNIKTYYIPVNKYVGGALQKYRKRIGGQTAYQIRDRIINHKLIVDSNDFLESKEEKKKRAKKYKSKSISSRDICICKEIGAMFDIDVMKLSGVQTEDIEIKTILEILKKLYFQSSNDFINYVVKKFKLDTIICEALRDLHESIICQYLNITKLYMKRFPKKACLSNETINYPHNYSPSLVLLKNINFTDQDIHQSLEKIQGFCPFEPKVRVKQLLDFPIDDLIKELDLPLVKYTPKEKYRLIADRPPTRTNLPPPPNGLSDVELIKWYSEKIIDRCKILQPDIEFYEKRYTDVAKSITEISNFLQANMPN